MIPIPQISYTIKASAPQTHLFEVMLTIMHPKPQGQLVCLPGWIPGSYLVRDFARHIVDIRAECLGKPILLQKCDKSTWQVGETSGVLTLYYRVYAYDLSVRGAYLDTTRGFFNGASVFLAVIGQEHQPCNIIIEKPKGKAYRAWKIATSLPIAHDKDARLGEYYANDYDELIDHPVEMGTFSLFQFKACDIVHEVVITGRCNIDPRRLMQDMQKICAYQIEFFGRPAPFTRYVFLVMVTDHGYGGLEHRASAALMCSRDDLPCIREGKTTPGYRRFLGLVSHEYFHGWNVKQIKPQIFSPYVLSSERYTRLLWAFEGVTSYYDDLILARTELISVDEYLIGLGTMISSMIRDPGSAIQNLEEASFDAWIKYYRQDENSPNSLVSYYSKGAIVALLLDATIRQASKGERSLDDVMRALWHRYGKDFATTGHGVGESEWERVAQEIAGVDLSEFFSYALRQTKALPLKKSLAYLGVEYQERAASSSQDRGGQWHDQLKPAPKTLGVRFTAEPAGVRITHVLTGGPAEAAGLCAGDLLLAMDGLRADAATLELKVAEHTTKRAITFHLFRRDELMKLTVKCFNYSRPVCALRMKKNVKGTHAASWLASDRIK